MNAQIIETVAEYDPGYNSSVFLDTHGLVKGSHSVTFDSLHPNAIPFRETIASKLGKRFLTDEEMTIVSNGVFRPTTVSKESKVSNRTYKDTSSIEEDIGKALIIDIPDSRSRRRVSLASAVLFASARQEECRENRNILFREQLNHSWCFGSDVTTKCFRYPVVLVYCSTDTTPFWILAYSEFKKRFDETLTILVNPRVRDELYDSYEGVLVCIMDKPSTFSCLSNHLVSAVIVDKFLDIRPSNILNESVSVAPLFGRLILIDKNASRIFADLDKFSNQSWMKHMFKSTERKKEYDELYDHNVDNNMMWLTSVCAETTMLSELIKSFSKKFRETPVQKVSIIKVSSPRGGIFDFDAYSVEEARDCAIDKLNIALEKGDSSSVQITESFATISKCCVNNHNSNQRTLAVFVINNIVVHRLYRIFFRAIRRGVYWIYGHIPTGT